VGGLLTGNVTDALRTGACLVADSVELVTCLVAGVRDVVFPVVRVRYSQPEISPKNSAATCSIRRLTFPLALNIIDGEGDTIKNNS
jgi:hypothetical protein